MLSRCTVSKWVIQWCNSAGGFDPKNLFFKVDEEKNIVYIITDRPGLLIGKNGSVIKAAQDELTALCKQYKEKELKIEFIEAVRGDYYNTFDPMAYCF